MAPSEDFAPQSTVLEQRVDRLENREIDLRMAVSALVETVNLHQANFEAMQRNIEAMNRQSEQRARETDRKFEVFVEAIQQQARETDRKFEAIVEAIQVMQSEIRGLQTENRRILDHLLGQQDNLG